jgi:hypothetical protein
MQNVQAFALAYLNAGGNTPAENMAESANVAKWFARAQPQTAAAMEIFLAVPAHMAAALLHAEAVFNEFVDCGPCNSDQTGAALHALHPLAPQAVYIIVMYWSM